MAEKDTIFDSKIKYTGFFNFSDFYDFCHKWLTEETNLGNLKEKKYSEKLKGDEKEIEVDWEGSKKLTDYFKMDMKIEFKVKRLKKVEVNQNGAKTSTNQGEIEIKVKGILVKDYQGKFEMNSFQKFLRSIYEKWVIPSRIDEYEGRIAGESDEFLSQAKAWLDLEGKK